MKIKDHCLEFTEQLHIFTKSTIDSWLSPTHRRFVLYLSLTVYADSHTLCYECSLTVRLSPRTHFELLHYRSKQHNFLERVNLLTNISSKFPTLKRFTESKLCLVPHHFFVHLNADCFFFFTVLMLVTYNSNELVLERFKIKINGCNKRT